MASPVGRYHRLGPKNNTYTQVTSKTNFSCRFFQFYSHTIIFLNVLITLKLSLVNHSFSNHRLLCKSRTTKTLKKESNQRVGVCNVLAHAQEHSMESHGRRWKVPWNVTESTGNSHRKSWKLPEVSREYNGNFQMILRRFGFLIMVTREELEPV